MSNTSPQICLRCDPFWDIFHRGFHQNVLHSTVVISSRVYHPYPSNPTERTNLVTTSPHYFPLVKLFHIPPSTPAWPGFCSWKFGFCASEFRFRLSRPPNLSTEDLLLPAAAAAIPVKGSVVLPAVVVAVLVVVSLGGLPEIALPDVPEDWLAVRGL